MNPNTIDVINMTEEELLGLDWKKLGDALDEVDRRSLSTAFCINLRKKALNVDNSTLVNLDRVEQYIVVSLMFFGVISVDYCALDYALDLENTFDDDTVLKRIDEIVDDTSTFKSLDMQIQGWLLPFMSSDQLNEILPVLNPEQQENLIDWLFRKYQFEASVVYTKTWPKLCRDAQFSLGRYYEKLGMLEKISDEVLFDLCSEVQFGEMICMSQERIDKISNEALVKLSENNFESDAYFIFVYAVGRMSTGRVDKITDDTLLKLSEWACRDVVKKMSISKLLEIDLSSVANRFSKENYEKLMEAFSASINQIDVNTFCKLDASKKAKVLHMLPPQKIFEFTSEFSCNFFSSLLSQMPPDKVSQMNSDEKTFSELNKKLATSLEGKKRKDRDSLRSSTQNTSKFLDSTTQKLFRADEMNRIPRLVGDTVSYRG